MILTCPRCATRYLVDDLQVWSTGRTVQCEECGRRWRAAGAGIRSAPVSAPPEPFSPEADERWPEPQVHDHPPGESRDIPLEPASSAPAPETPAGGGGSLFAPTRSSRRARPSVTRVRQTPVLVLFGWVAVLLLVVALAWAIARRDDVVRAVPATAGAYSAVGLAADSGGPSK